MPTSVRREGVSSHVRASHGSGMLREALRTWWRQESADWDSAVEGAPGAQPAAGVWDDMPTVDSKAIARSSPLFEQHLGVRLDVTLIRKGGYTSIDDAIRHLVPEMERIASTHGRNSTNQGRTQ
jgi:Arc/MetJ-type ribon-helix-helix transcriptional regulator